MSIENDLHNARFVVDRTRRDLEDARALDSAPLIALLEPRLAKFELAIKASEDLPAFIAAAETAMNVATKQLRSAENAQVHGALDRGDALTLADDTEHARQVMRIRARELDAAKNMGLSPLAKINAMRSNDRARDGAEKRARGAARACLERTGIGGGYDDPATVGDWSAETESAEESAWAPLFEARELAAYPMNAKSSKDARPVDVLRKAFTIRNGWRARRAGAQPGT